MKCNVQTILHIIILGLLVLYAAWGFYHKEFLILIALAVLTSFMSVCMYMSKKEQTALKGIKKESMKYEIISAIREEIGLKRLKHKIVGKIGKAIEADRCILIDVDIGKKDYQGVTAEYRANENISSMIDYNLIDFPLWCKDKYSHSEFVIVSDSQNYLNEYNLHGSPLEEYFIENSVKSGFGIPLYVKDLWIGVLVVHYTQKNKVFQDNFFVFVNEIAPQIAMALYQSKVFDETKDVAARESLLRKIDRAIVSILDIGELKQAIVAEIGKAMNADRCVIYQIDQNTGKFFIVDKYSEYVSSSEILSHVGIDPEDEEFRSAIEFVRLGRREMIIYDIDNPPTYLDRDIVEMLKRYQLKSTYVLPILHRDEFLGFLYINYVKEITEISESQLSFCRDLADLAGVALHNVNLYKRLEDALKREHLLISVVETLRSTIDIDEILDIVCKSVSHSLKVERVAMVETPDLEDPAGFILKNEYKFASIQGFDQLHEYHQDSLLYGIEQIYGEKTRLLINTPDDKGIPDYYRDMLKEMGVKSQLGVPVKKGDDSWGVLVISSYKDYRYWLADEVLLLRSIADYLYIAIEQAKLYQTILQKAELEEAQKTFLATLIHDLRSPLTAVQKALEFIVSRSPETQLLEFREYLEDIYLTNDDLLVIINDILTIYHLESGKFGLVYENCNISDIISDSFKTLKYLAIENNSELFVDIKDNLPNIDLDKTKLKRVLVNLISNAIKHNENGIKVVVCAKSNNGFIEVSVKDNGKGIPESARGMIFQRFPTGKRHIGTGLGLYLSKGIIEAHNGTIWFETETDKGTTFYFTLPITGAVI